MKGLVGLTHVVEELFHVWRGFLDVLNVIWILGYLHFGRHKEVCEEGRYCKP